jgi:histidine phosphotransferase ChpT
VVRAEGPRLILDPEIRAAMLGQAKASDISPRTVGAWLAHEILQRAMADQSRRLTRPNRHC